MRQQAQTRGQELSLRMATMYALRTEGIRLFEQPNQYLGIVLDLTDKNASTIKVFKHHCDEELLDIFVAASHAGTTAAIEEAANKAMFLLRDDRCVAGDVAEQVSCEISFALANYLGVEPPVHVRFVATHNTDSAGDSPSASTDPTSSGTASSSSGTDPTSSGTASSSSGTNPASSGGKNTPDSTPSTRVDVSQLSTNRVKRIRQIVNAGVGMDWFGWLKCWCWFGAGLCVLSVFQTAESLSSQLPLQSLSDGKDYLSMVQILSCLGSLVIACLFIASWSRLSRFKSNGPKMFLGTSIADAILPLLICIVGMLLAPQYLSYDIANGALLEIACITLLRLAYYFINFVYLKKRQRFFDL